MWSSHGQSLQSAILFAAGPPGLVAAGLTLWQLCANVVGVLAPCGLRPSLWLPKWLKWNRCCARESDCLIET